MEQKDFLLDFDLYICERYGYRNSLYVIPTMNGCCVNVNIKPTKLYIRFWEYSKGVGGFPDWCIILVHCNFAKKQEQEFCRNLCGSSRSMRHDTDTGISGLRIIHD
ncbi:MAG: hypothetical protein RRY39_01295 [Odoribacter sp.]